MEFSEYFQWDRVAPFFAPPCRWLPVSCRSGACQGKFAGQRPTFFHWARPPTPTEHTGKQTTYKSEASSPASVVRWFWDQTRWTRKVCSSRAARTCVAPVRARGRSTDQTASFSTVAPASEINGRDRSVCADNPHAVALVSHTPPVTSECGGLSVKQCDWRSRIYKWGGPVWYKCGAMTLILHFSATFRSFSDALPWVFLQNITLLTSMRFVAFWTEEFFDPTNGDGSDL